MLDRGREQQMIAVIYAMLGIFLIRASRDPFNHLSVIWFAMWSSLVHAVVMAVHAVMDLSEWVHLVGDIPALMIVAVVFAVLTPRRPASPPP
jgi:EamA domain-containing membrane protein RarD